MAEKPEDFKLPTSVVQKIIKDALPDGVNVDKDARDAIARATSIFILYTTTCANGIAVGNKRKTMTAQDIIDSISNMAFDEFINELIKWHDGFRKEKARKQKQKTKKQGETSSNQNQSNFPVNQESSMFINEDSQKEMILYDDDDEMVLNEEESL